LPVGKVVVSMDSRAIQLPGKSQKLYCFTGTNIIFNEWEEIKIYILESKHCHKIYLCRQRDIRRKNRLNVNPSLYRSGQALRCPGV